jgi:hypothetical protein
MEEVTKNTSEKRERPQNKHLSKTGGPGRPKGQRNYATIYREALIKIADANDKTPEEIENMMEEVGLRQGLKGNFQFWKDVRDRIHGQAKNTVEVNASLDINVTISDEEKAKLLALLNDERRTS